MIGLGERDLLMGLDWLQSEAHRDGRFPFILSNLECENARFDAARIVEFGGQTMAVYAMISPSILTEQMYGRLRICTEVLNNCSISNPSDWLRKNQERCGYSCGLCGFKLNEMDALAPWVDLVVETKIGKMNHHPKAIDSTTVWVGRGSKGKNVIEVELGWDLSTKGFHDPDVKIFRTRFGPESKSD